jgi:hypothetical protein
LDTALRAAVTDAEDGLLRPGALPQLSIASAAGNKALLDAVEKAGLGLGKAWNQKPKFLEESMDPNRVSNNHNSFLKFLVEFIDPQTHDISLQVQSSFRIPYHQFLQPITNLQVSNPIHKKNMILIYCQSLCGTGHCPEEETKKAEGGGGKRLRRSGSRNLDPKGYFSVGGVTSEVFQCEDGVYQIGKHGVCFGVECTVAGTCSAVGETVPRPFQSYHR